MYNPFYFHRLSPHTFDLYALEILHFCHNCKYLSFFIFLFLLLIIFYKNVLASLFFFNVVKYINLWLPGFTGIRPCFLVLLTWFWSSP